MTVRERVERIVRTALGGKRPGQQLAARFPDVVEALHERGFATTPLFDAIARWLPRDEHWTLDCGIDEVERAWVVAASLHAMQSSIARKTWVPVGPALEEREGLALFSQLLMNGACELDDAEAVMRVLEATAHLRPLRDDSDLDRCAAYWPRDLHALWEPPHVAARTLRFCAMDTQRYVLGAISVDVVTCAVAWEERGELTPTIIIRGRGYDARATLRGTR